MVFFYKFNAIVLKDELLKEQDIIFIPQIGFHIFKEGIWQKVDEQHLKKIIQNKLGANSKRNYINETLEAIKNDTYRTLEQLNKNRNRLVLLNGTLDITEWNNPIFYEEKFFKEDYSIIRLNCNYNLNSSCPVFERYLKTTFSNDDNMNNLVAEILGYCLTTSTKFHKAFIFYGTGSNGKSVLLNIIEKLITYKNIASVSMSDLDKPFCRSALNGKLVNISSELEGYVKETGYFKKIVSGDLIDAQYKFKDSFEFHPYCKLIFAMNTLPKTKDKSDGFYRRLIIVPFEKIFKETEQDRELEAKLEQELEGILLFALYGLKRLAVNNKFTIPEKVNLMLDQYKTECSPISQFLNDCVEFNENEKVKCQELYEEYKKYCLKNGYKPMNNGNFGREIKRLYPQIEKHRLTLDGYRQNYYIGFSLSNNDTLDIVESF